MPGMPLNLVFVDDLNGSWVHGNAHQRIACTKGIQAKANELHKRR